ncbi:ATP-binding protein [Streptomyces sp. NPDC017993]|uniref:ATP-binding protein n=1 Tax=Streptomyces sp. NPDC017993 TaxID=3365027 RepID=UPI0037A7CBE4
MQPTTAAVPRTPFRVTAGARPHLLAVPSEPTAAKVARDFIRTALRGTPLAPLLDNAVLLTSEAVTTSHLRAPASADVLLRLLTADHGLRVSVHDEAPGRIPAQTAPGRASDQEPDHGLLLFRHLADDWGTAPAAGPRRSPALWFELRTAVQRDS